MKGPQATITVTEAALLPWRATDRCEDSRDGRWFSWEAKTKGSHKR